MFLNGIKLKWLVAVLSLLIGGCASTPSPKEWSGTSFSDKNFSEVLSEQKEKIISNTFLILDTQLKHLHGKDIDWTHSKDNLHAEPFSSDNKPGILITFTSLIKASQCCEEFYLLSIFKRVFTSETKSITKARQTHVTKDDFFNSSKRLEIVKNIKKVLDEEMQKALLKPKPDSKATERVRTLLKAVKKAREDIETLTQKIELYKLQYNKYPDTLADLMGQTPIDPWGEEYQYRFPGKKSEFDVWSNNSF